MANKRIYNQISAFGELYAYLVILSPPEKIKKEIATIKNDLNAICDITQRNVTSIAHITLVDKLTDDLDFPDTIQNFVKNVKPFKITISGWDYFDHGHSVTLYLNILNPEPIRELMILVKSPSKSPHISLAKRIPQSTFLQLKPYLDTLNYSAEWNCTEIIVLKKLMSQKHLGFKDKIIIPLQ